VAQWIGPLTASRTAACATLDVDKANGALRGQELSAGPTRLVSERET
jgi:hypothetical protein